MAIKVAVVSQKGGVGKSSIARLIGREFADNGWLVNIADMDVQQATSYHWYQRRAANQIRPKFTLEPSRVSAPLWPLRRSSTCLFLMVPPMPAGPPVTWPVHPIS